MERRRDANLVDVELGRLVGMPVDYRRHLPDHFATTERDDHEVPGLGEIGEKAPEIDRLVEHVVGDPVEVGGVAATDTLDLDFPRRAIQCRASP